MKVKQVGLLTMKWSNSSSLLAIIWLTVSSSGTSSSSWDMRENKREQMFTLENGDCWQDMEIVHHKRVSVPHPALRAPGWPAGKLCARGWKTSGQTYRPGWPSGPRSACIWQRPGSSPPRCSRCTDAAHAPRSAARYDGRDPGPADPRRDKAAAFRNIKYCEKIKPTRDIASNQ